MEEIGNYRIIEQIDETKKTLLYRCKKAGETQTVIVKLLKPEYTTQVEIARFKQEYKVIKSIDLDCVVKSYGFIQSIPGSALILEDFTGIPITKLPGKQSIRDLHLFLKLAIKIAKALGQLHEKNIFHRDIKPANILVNPGTGQIKITNFAFSTVLPWEDLDIYNRRTMEDVFTYIAPEQTGRMNRPVDYRTDLYSLGITFYEMLTGTVPFKFSDALEMIHAHIARRPLEPIVSNPDIPKTLSRIIMKLLSKTAEERYQNSFGLMYDLKKCLQQLEENGEIEEFELALIDIPVKFIIPPILAGRERQLACLLDCYQKVIQGSIQIMFISGDPGIGKSALVNEIHKPVTAQRGYFISGKYEQLRKNDPYSSIISAFQGLIRQILMGSEDLVLTWKKNLLTALKENGQVIIDVIPELECIIGKQPPVTELNPEEAKNRFHLVFKNFIKVFATENHPLVLFLDDLQWVDTASIHLLEALIYDVRLKYFFLICSYRDREMLPSHPVKLLKDALIKQGIGSRDIQLPALDVENVNKLISFFLRTSMEKTWQLATIIHHKTNGNPFFINQFLKILYEDKIIRFDIEKGWQWEPDTIYSLHSTDNVVELMAGKIAKLPQNILDVLKIGACIGNRFEPGLLAAVLELPMDDILSTLHVVAREGLIGVNENFYLFSHDRIQEAVYSLIPGAEKKQIHYKIGRLLLENAGPGCLDEQCALRMTGKQAEPAGSSRSERAVQDAWTSSSRSERPVQVYAIVNHLNHGIELIKSKEEKAQLSYLNFLAGHKAIESSAFHSAVEYTRAAIALLDSDCWQVNYKRTFQVFKAALECEYYTGNYREADNIRSVLFIMTRGKIDLAQVYTLLIMLYLNIGKPEEAVRLGIQGLKLFGVKISYSPSSLDILLEAIKVKFASRKLKVETIPRLPDMQDPEKLAIVELLTAVAPCVSVSGSYLLAVTILKPIYYYIKYGNTPFAAWTWLASANIEARILGHYQKGYRIGQAALELEKKYNNKKFKSKILLTYVYSILHWKQHARDGLPYLKAAYEYGVESGDFHYARNSINLATIIRMITGDNLYEVFEECSKYEDFFGETKHALLAANYADNKQLYFNLTGKTGDKHTLDSGAYTVEKQFALYDREKSKLLRVFLLVNILRSQYLFKNYRAAFATVKEIEKDFDAIMGILYETEFHFYRALTLTASYPGASGREKRKFRKLLCAYQKLMKTWALNCPENFLHKYLLLEAERLRISGSCKKWINKDIMHLYNQAIKSAYENGYINNAAIANELAAEFYLENGMENSARLYIKEAHAAYTRWGATAKVHDLEVQFGKWLTGSNVNKQAAEPAGDISFSLPVSSMEALDLNTIIKASQAISGEIVLSSLLKRMMRILMENAGAERGILLLENNGNFFIEASEEPAKESIVVLESIPINQYRNMAASVIHYVSRIKQPLILNNAALQGDFVNDPYIKKNQTRSILAFPIIKQGKVFGIIYLENSLASGSFDQARLELLKVISSQAAISIDNARLYAHLEEKIRERTGELHASNKKLEAAMQELWGEMRLAQKIQTILLPPEPVIPGYEISAHMMPAEKVGGDYYDVIHAGDKHWIVIGDVSGHGVPAGLVMMMVQTSIHNTLYQYPQLKPSELLTRVNKTITANIKRLKENKYMTMTAFTVNGNGLFTFSGLHLVLLIYRAAAGAVEQIETSGMWIGFLEDISSINTDREFVLQPGDILLLYTDGIVEAWSKKEHPGAGITGRSMFELEKLKQILSESGIFPPRLIVDALLNELKKNYEWDDDVTVMVIKRLE